ncbi:methyl-accepting chemotaxis protein [Propionivibrio sp.]|uniref:methyl-accepting chemotaxis protein n=1 Tax=Propionivibrio sp. TaxID=2212460 RepID=UPI00260844CC|nr:methyl-accepting chemotaxis protein [Propionivibrio sp.]
MFKNLKIGVRLGIGFAVTLILMIVLAAISITRVSELQTEISSLVNDKNVKTKLANDIVDAINTVGRAHRNILIYKNDETTRVESDRRLEMSKRVNTIMESLNKLSYGDKGKAALSAVVEARHAYAIVMVKFEEQVKAKQWDEAAKYFATEYRPLFNEYLKQTNAFADYQFELSEKVGAEAESLAQSTRTLAIGLTLGAVLITLLLAFLIVRSITGPTAKLVDALNKMAVGDLNFKLDFRSRDEVGLLAKAIEAIQAAIQRMVADADSLSAAAVEGRLATRADASKHQGDFQKVVTGVNNTLDAVIGPLNVTARYVDDISKGVIPPIITDSYNGDFNIIKGNLNNLVKMMSDLLAQTDIIIKGAADGELDKRANADMFVGGWNQLVTGVNEAITNIVNPMNVTADYVDKVAKGIIPPVITTEYKGQYNIIKNNLNNMVKMMSDLLAQTDIIIKGAADGELDKRANADMFVGGWNQLVKGVNEAITNIVNPMNVTADYVDKVAKGIIPPAITTEYKGQYNIIKNNLNNMVKMMSDLLAQTDILIKGAAAGELEKRANADLFVGGWNQLVNGVNDILNNVVPPIQEVQRVLAAMEHGDMTQTITKAYQGDFATLKDAINNTIAKLSETITQINTAADALTNAAAQVSATAQSLSQSSSEQAASVEETTSSMEQMTASISQNTENAKITDGMASKSAKEAAEGGDAVSKTVEDMKSIAGKIGIIDDIAYQTNLLALNAAIEAARAGDHGKGFAVVAAEVRKLAERSQIAAQEIGNLASSSVKQAERAGALLTEMVPSIRKTSDLVQEIASASQEQSSGVAQINGAMGQLNQTTQQNASASEELAATAEELGAQASELQQTMTFFKLDHGARTTRSTHKPAPPARSMAAGSSRMGTVQIHDGDFERF